MNFIKSLFSRRALVKSTKIFGGVAAIYLVLALTLIFWPKSQPFENNPLSQGAWDAYISEQDRAVVNPATATMHTFTARDGTQIFSRRFKSSDATEGASASVIIYMHGIASDSGAMVDSASLLRGATVAEIIVPDFRGHGQSGGPRSDVSYIGQYEDDLEDIINAILVENPNASLIIAGHSMGGGVAMRYALKKNAVSPQAYILLAPNFGEGPTQRTGSEAESQRVDDSLSFVEFDTKRMIGQIMLNGVGIRALDHKPIMFFNRPKDILAYSYRSVLSAQPIRPNTSDRALRAVNVPLLVIVGGDDELFVAENFEPFISAHSDGETIIVDGETHDGILHSRSAFSHIQAWYQAFK